MGLGCRLHIAFSCKASSARSAAHCSYRGSPCRVNVRRGLSLPTSSLPILTGKRKHGPRPALYRMRIASRSRGHDMQGFSSLAGMRCKLTLGAAPPCARFGQRRVNVARSPRVHEARAAKPVLITRL